MEIDCNSYHCTIENYKGNMDYLLQAGEYASFNSGSADEWLKKLDEKGLLAGDNFFEKRTTLYDAMPSVWKDLAIEDRTQILKIIKDVYDTAPADGEVWTKARVIQLAKYVPFSQMHKLRACYFAAEKDPSVITCQEGGSQ